MGLLSFSERAFVLGCFFFFVIIDWLRAIALLFLCEEGPEIG